MITRRKVIVGSAALAAAATLPLLPTESEMPVRFDEPMPWRARVFWRTTYFNHLQNAVDTMDAFLRGEYGDIIGVPEFGHEERIIVVRGGPQEFRWVGEHDMTMGWVNEGGTLIARVVECESMFRRGGGGLEIKVGLVWTSTGRGSA